MLRGTLILAVILSVLPAALQAQTTWQVGSTRALKKPSQAAAVARDGDTVAIDSELYLGDVATWRQNNLTLRAVGTTRAVLRANGNHAGGKGIWVIGGTNVRVENIEFAEARVPDRNGAGIRHEAGKLTVVNCLFRDNENGILANNDSTVDLTVDRSEFARNGRGDGYTHGLYVGQARRLTVQASYFRDTPVGHLIKSRAQDNLIQYNRIFDKDGSPSYSVNVSNGGVTYLIGNEIRQNTRTQNPIIVSYAEEGVRFADNRLYVVNNTIINDLVGRGVFIVNRGPNPAQLANNIFMGYGPVIDGPGVLTNNLLALFAGGTPSANPLNGAGNSGNRTTSSLVLPEYRLAAGSAAIGMAIDPATVLGTAVQLNAEYVHPLRTKFRRLTAPFDAGAHAYP
jgi:hypothetical protein